MVKTAILLAIASAIVAHGYQNAFSRKAAQPDTVGNGGRLTAPDGKTSVLLGSVVKQGEPHLLLTFNVGGRKWSFDVGRAIGAELLWSPDSKAVAATISNVSPNGIYHLLIFRVGRRTVRKINATEAVRMAFGHPVVCAYPEPPNVAAVSWLRASSELLVAAQIVDHSVCDSFGTFKLYDLSIPGLTVHKAYDQLQAKHLFGPELGSFLQHARDICVTNPKACEVPANHGRSPTRR